MIIVRTPQAGYAVITGPALPVPRPRARVRYAPSAVATHLHDYTGHPWVYMFTIRHLPFGAQAFGLLSRRPSALA